MTASAPNPLPRPAVQSWDFPRGVAGVALIVGFGNERGAAAADLLRGTSLTPQVLEDPQAQVDAHTELAVLRNLLHSLGEPPGLGLDLGRRYRVATFGIFGFACISSPTLREAIVFALRYLDLSFTFCIPRASVVEDNLRLRLADQLVPHDVRAFLVQRDLAAIVTVMNDLLAAPIPIHDMELRAAEPHDVTPYQDVFGVRPRFGRNENVTVVDAAHLDRPLPQANEHTVALCEAQCRQVVARRRARAGITDEVRQRLIRLGGAPGLDDIAGELTMSPRTLRRKLAEAGTSYRALQDEVRQALAEELLSTGALTVSDVALRLGYAEAASFIHAFKRWTGSTPTAYLRGHTAADDDAHQPEVKLD